MTKENAGHFGSHSVGRHFTRRRRLSLATLLLLVVALAQVKPAWAAAPVVDNITASPSIPFALDSYQPVVLTVTYSDSDPGDTHYVIVTWDDGTTCEAHGVAPDTTINDYCSIDTATKTITASHLYATTGVFAPSIDVITNPPGSGKKGKQYRYVVIFDDNKGHIKGAGGFDLVHQYNQFSTSYGPTQFGFTVGYNANGTFRSNSRVRYSVYNDDLSLLFTFSSTSFNWMVISGANAILSGTGTIGTTSYNFVLSIIDGELQNPPGSDRFRIRITNQNGTTFYNGTLYYDNEFAPTPTRDILLFDPLTVAGGQIVIADAPGVASIGGPQLVIVGNPPQEVIENVGLTEVIFIPFAAD